MARLRAATRHRVVILYQPCFSQMKISKQTEVSRCDVQALLKKHKETGNTEDHRRSGRSRKVSATDERGIKLITLRNRKMHSSAISSDLSETSVTQQHPSTVRRSLARSCFDGRVAAIKPYLDVETRPSESSIPKKFGTGAKKNSSSCSGLMSKNVYYLLLQKYSQIQIHYAIPSGRHTIGPYSALPQRPQTYMKSLRTIFSVRKNNKS